MAELTLPYTLVGPSSLEQTPVPIAAYSSRTVYIFKYQPCPALKTYFVWIKGIFPGFQAINNLPCAYNSDARILLVPVLKIVFNLLGPRGLPYHLRPKACSQEGCTTHLRISGTFREKCAPKFQVKTNLTLLSVRLTVFGPIFVPAVSNCAKL